MKKIHMVLFIAALGFGFIFALANWGCEGEKGQPVDLERAKVLEVLSTTPEDGATGVLVNTEISAIFSKSVNTASINENTFIVQDSNGNPVDGVINYVDDDKTATFTPAANLNLDTTYKVALTSGLRDVYGTPTQKSFEWSFSTVTSTATLLPRYGIDLTTQVVVIDEKTIKTLEDIASQQIANWINTLPEDACQKPLLLGATYKSGINFKQLNENKAVDIDVTKPVLVNFVPLGKPPFDITFLSPKRNRAIVDQWKLRGTADWTVEKTDTHFRITNDTNTYYFDNGFEDPTETIKVKVSDGCVLPDGSQRSVEYNYKLVFKYPEETIDKINFYLHFGPDKVKHTDEDSLLWIEFINANNNYIADFRKQLEKCEEVLSYCTHFFKVNPLSGLKSRLLKEIVGVTLILQDPCSNCNKLVFDLDKIEFYTDYWRATYDNAQDIHGVPDGEDELVVPLIMDRYKGNIWQRRTDPGKKPSY